MATAPLTVVAEPYDGPAARLLQPEAIGLYRSSGYRPIPAYGFYRCAPGSRCFGKAL